MKNEQDYSAQVQKPKPTTKVFWTSETNLKKITEIKTENQHQRQSPTPTQL